MAIEVTMPQMGESVVEGTIAKWLVREGDRVELDQPIAEISTDKVDAEIPAPGAGVIAAIVAHEGDTVPVGGKIAIIEPAGAATSAPAPPAAAPSAVARVAGDGAARGPALGAAAPSAPLARPAAARPAEPADGPRRYSPVVLRMAAEYGVDLSRVPGTGIGGRVTKRDLAKYIESLGAGVAPPVAPPRADVGATPPSTAPRVEQRAPSV